MIATTKVFLRSVAACAVLFAAVSGARAATIIKLNLADVGPDIQMNAGGALSTVNDGGPGTGDQQTAVEFTGFLNFLPDINTDNASFTMAGLTTNGAPTVNGTLVTQGFQGGQFLLYDPANVLLLSGNLSNSALAGVVGPPGTGALFTTTFGAVTGGTLAGLIAPNSIALSMNITNVNGGNGFGVTGNVLNAFVADASVNISGQVPEPTTIALFGFGSAALVAIRRRRR